VTRRAMWPALCALFALAVCTPVAGAGDRLERFRALAAGDLAAAQLDGGSEVDRVVSELYALVDEEIVESLETGSPFSSVEFIQERLDGLASAWGGAAFRVLRPPAGPGRPILTVAVLSLTGVPGSGSMRVYGSGPGGVLPLRTATYDGLPEVHGWPAARDGAPQWLMSWTGAASGRGVRPVRLELWRQRGGEAARAWSTADLFPDGLWASAVAVRRGEISIRYELRYPGWKPGCDGQTEQEDTYHVAAGDVPGLARRHVVNGWHRDLGTAVDRFFAALGRRDARRLSELVPDARVRSRLPAGLRPEPACEAQSPDTPGVVVVAATDEGRAGEAAPSGSVAGRPPSPWSLWWTRAAGGAWRLSAAEPVLQ
jgi:hypothetical protein